jgi:hypothetical protein
MNPVRGSTPPGEPRGSPALVPSSIVNPPVDYARAEKKGDAESGVGHGVSIFFFHRFLHTPSNPFFSSCWLRSMDTHLTVHLQVISTLVLWWS